MKTANQLAEVRANFLRALKQPGGADVIVVETVTTGGTWDSGTDQMTGATTSEQTTTYCRHALLVPLRISDDIGSDGMQQKSAYSNGHLLGQMGVGEVLVCKVRPEVPLSTAHRYAIGGNSYKFDAILESRAFGLNKPLWNLVKFIRG